MPRDHSPPRSAAQVPNRPNPAKARSAARLPVPRESIMAPPRSFDGRQFRAHRLAVQDVALSRRKRGFDSPWARQRNQRLSEIFDSRGRSPRKNVGAGVDRARSAGLFRAKWGALRRTRSATTSTSVASPGFLPLLQSCGARRTTIADDRVLHKSSFLLTQRRLTNGPEIDSTCYANFPKYFALRRKALRFALPCRAHS